MFHQIASVAVIYSTELWKMFIFVAIFCLPAAACVTECDCICWTREPMEMYTVNMLTGGKYSSI